MNQKAVYSAYIGILAIIAVTVLVFSNLSLLENTKNVEETRFFGKVYEQWFTARIALDKAFSDALADISYKETINGICPSNIKDTVNASDIQPYFDAVTASISSQSVIECTALNLNVVISENNPYNADLSMDLKCTASTKNKLSVVYTVPVTLKKKITFNQNPAVPPAGKTCDVSISDRDSEKEETRFTK